MLQWSHWLSWGAFAGGYGSEDKPEPTLAAMESKCKNPMAILLHYADGLKATVRSHFCCICHTPSNTVACCLKSTLRVFLETTYGMLDQLCLCVLFITATMECGQVLLLNGYVTMMSYAAYTSPIGSQSSIAACEFFLPGGPAAGDHTVEPDTGSCWTGYAYFSYLLLNAEELVLTKRPVYRVRLLTIQARASRSCCLGDPPSTNRRPGRRWSAAC